MPQPQKELGAYVKTVRQFAVLHRRYAPVIGANGVACYSALMSHLRTGIWSCNPSQKTLASEMGLISTKRAEDAVAKLEAAGLVTVERRKGGGRNATNIYTLREIWAEFSEVRSAAGTAPQGESCPDQQEEVRRADNTVRIDGIHDVTTPVNADSLRAEDHQTDVETPSAPMVEVGSEVRSEVSCIWFELNQPGEAYPWRSEWQISTLWRFAAQCLPPARVDSAFEKFVKFNVGRGTVEKSVAWTDL